MSIHSIHFSRHWPAGWRAVLLAVFPFITADSFAAQHTLSGASGATLPGLAFGTAGNWSPAAVPGVGDNAVIAATGLVDVRGSALGGAREIQDLSFTGASALTLHNNSSSTAMVLSLNGGRGAAMPLISATGNVTRTIAGPGTNATPQTLGLQLLASGSVDVAANVLTISARFSESGGARQLTKTGAGTLVLSGRNSYSGGTVVNAGVLELNGAGGGNGRVDGTVTVASGAELRVTGGDGTGLGYNSGNKVDSLVNNGGLVSAVTTSHVWNATVTMTGGELRSNGGVSSATATSYFEWGNSPLNTNAAATSAVVSGRIRIRNDANPFLTLNVADGAAPVDLLVSAAITQANGKCGVIKQGAGTAKLTGAVELDGVITVEDGTLDVSTAALGTGVQINVTNRGVLMLPATFGGAVFVSGEKLAPGTWGPPGSVAAGTAQNESPVIAGGVVVTLTNTELSARERWRNMHYGMLVHYVWGGSGTETRNVDGSNATSLEAVANGFDAQGFADDLASAGVEYVFFTAWHSNFIPLFNSSAVVNNFGFQRNSSRDMIGDMVAAVRAKGIRVLLYANIGQVSVTYDNRWNDVMEDIFAEMLDRYDIDGFFMDENDPSGNMSWDFPRIARAIRLRKPDAVTIQNFYGSLYTWDGPVGESGPATPWLSPDISWTLGSPYAQVISQTWSAVHGKVPTANLTATRSAEGIFRGTVVGAGSCTEGGGYLWSAGPFVGNGTWRNPATNQTEFVGRWEAGVLEAMQGAGAYIAPIAESVKGVRPSNSWRPSGGISSLPWGVATRKPDDSREYIHVLNPQPTKTLNLPPPADGKVFANARLLPSGNAVTMVQSSRGISLTLGAADNWNALDTVIALDVIAKGGPGLSNNDSPDVTYTGAWTYQKNRGLGEFRDDAHTTTANGASFTYTFDGTDIEFISSRGPARGTAQVFVDDVLDATINLQSAVSQPRVTVYARLGLARGRHTLRVVKQSGDVLTVDAFKVTEMVNNSDADFVYGALSNFNNTQTAANGVGYVNFGGGWNYQTRFGTEYNADIHWAQTNGSEATIHFNGTGIVWEGNAQGVVDFYLDGAFVQQTNMGAFGGRQNVVGLNISGLAPGAHQLRFVKVGGVYVEFDNFRVYNSVNDQWSADASGGAWNGDTHRTAQNEDFMSLAFTGTGLELLTRRGAEGGTVQVALDGSVVAYRNGYNHLTTAQWPLYDSLDTMPLENGQHTLRIVKKRASRMDVDAVRIFKESPPAPLAWGPTGAGGSGTWNVAATANWFDGGAATQWQDFGGTDYAALFAGTAGTVNLSTGIKANRLTFNTTGYTLGGSALTLNGTAPTVATPGGVTVVFNQEVAGTGGLTKTGPGTLVLNGANTNADRTTVAEGTLVANGTNTRGITVNEGATLAGIATVTGSITMNGHHSPGGDAVGILTHSGTISYGPTSHVAWQLNSHVNSGGSGTAYDRVSAQGITVAPGAVIDVTLNAPGSVVNFTNTFWSTARSWSLINHTSRTGSFELGTVTGDAGGRPAVLYGRFSLTHSATSVSLTWTPGTPIENWRVQYFGTTANTGSAADLFDADGDGEANLLEFSTAQNPLAARRTSTALVQNGAVLEFTFTRSKAAVANGVMFFVEWSENLTSWSADGVASNVLSDEDTTQQITARVPAGAVRRFVQLKVALP